MSAKKKPKCRCTSKAGVRKEVFPTRAKAMSVRLRMRGTKVFRTYACPTGRGYHVSTVRS